MVTDAELERSAPFVAEQVRVTPAVSVDNVVVEQPAEDAIPDSGSVADHEIVTPLRYQPFWPRVPEILDVITGGVVSITTLVVASAAALEASMFPARSRAML